MDIGGKTAIVTGAGKGIGRAIAEKLIEKECNLVAVSRTEHDLLELKHYAEKYGVLCTPVTVDLGSAYAVDQILKTIENSGIEIDILINVAGVFMTDGFLNVGTEDWDFMMTVNLKTMFFLSQRLLSLMKERGSGYIINFSSTVALGAKSEASVYSISKYGVAGLSEALYKEARKFGVKVSTIYPGVTNTPMLQKNEAPCSHELMMKPSDIADCVIFLLGTSERMIIKELVPWAVGFDQI